MEQVRSICQMTKRSFSRCEECDEETGFATAAEAAALTGQRLDQIAELVAKGALHLGLTPPGTFLVCLNSLLLQSGGNFGGSDTSQAIN